MSDNEGSFLFTSESVSEGHPDKLCDQVSDAILDACLSQDPESRVACETATKTDLIMLLGEIKTKAVIDYESIVRGVVRDVGYDSSDKGFDYKTCKLKVYIEDQSLEISEAVEHNALRNNCTITETGAGDQGLMFGYATDETPKYMPLTVVLAHEIIKRLTELRKNGEIEWLRPDAKSQVTVEYKYEKVHPGGEGACIPVRVHTVVLSTQTTEGIPLDFLRSTLIQKVVRAVIPQRYLDESTIFHIQPSGSFTIGGPRSDAGLTGRKIIVDTYGGWGAHGGGAFSGKDYTKVDRSGAYAARWVAVSLVAAGLCRRCLVQVSYAIGIAHPLSLFVNTYGTGTVSDAAIIEIVRLNLDLRPESIVKDLSLKRPMYRSTCLYGHFKNGFPWEIPKKLNLL